MMYLRMVHTGAHDKRSGRANGVFTAAHVLINDPEIDDADRDEIKQLLSVFDKLLPGRSTFGELPVYAIFWSKSTHAEIVRQSWQLVNLLRRHDLPVEMIKTTRPGRIVYEDEMQIAAIPWRETVT